MEDPAERRERLKRLRQEAAEQGATTDLSPPKEASKEFSDLSFRNYKPRNEVIGARKKEAAKPQALAAPAPSSLAAVIKDDQTAIEAFAPKKPHLDLKRDVAKSLRKLERETQRAIHDLRVELDMQEANA